MNPEPLNVKEEVKAVIDIQVEEITVEIETVKEEMKSVIDVEVEEIAVEIETVKVKEEMKKVIDAELDEIALEIENGLNKTTEALNESVQDVLNDVNNVLEQERAEINDHIAENLQETAEVFQESAHDLITGLKEIMENTKQKESILEKGKAFAFGLSSLLYTEAKDIHSSIYGNLVETADKLYESSGDVYNGLSTSAARETGEFTATSKKYLAAAANVMHQSCLDVLNASEQLLLKAADATTTSEATRKAQAKLMVNSLINTFLHFVQNLDGYLKNTTKTIKN
ncbi:hypothetical protein HDV02_004414 [Globomyces sp. JEL0801]|nr:hypothetical protein HDV02_004414 [Globomyces sp. JEL0801]